MTNVANEIVQLILKNVDKESGFVKLTPELDELIASKPSAVDAAFKQIAGTRDIEYHGTGNTTFKTPGVTTEHIDDNIPDGVYTSPSLRYARDYATDLFGDSASNFDRDGYGYIVPLKPQGPPLMRFDAVDYPIKPKSDITSSEAPESVWKPEQLRSIFAKNDPKHKGKAGLMLSAAGAAMLSSEDVKATPLTEEIYAKAEEKGYSREQVDAAYAKKKQNKEALFRQAAEAKGYSEEQISKALEARKAKSSVLTAEPSKIKDSVIPWKEYSDYELAKSGTTIGQIEQFENTEKRLAKYEARLMRPQQISDFTNLLSKAGREENRALRDRLAANVVSAANNEGLQVAYEDGNYYTLDPQGKKVEVTPGILDSMLQSRAEIAGGTVGARQGYKWTPGNWFTKSLGSIAGAAIGASTGAGLDYVDQSIQLDKEIKATEALDKAYGAAKVSAFFDSVFLGPLIAKHGVQAVGGAFTRTVDGNVSGAYDELLHVFNKTEEEAAQIVKEFERINNIVLEGTEKAKALKVLPTTQPGGEALISEVAMTDPHTAFTIVNETRNRAETLIKAAEGIADKEAPKRVLQSIKDYETATREMFHGVKEQFTELDVPADVVPDLTDKFKTVTNTIVAKMSSKDVAEISLITDQKLPMIQSILKDAADGKVSGDALMDARQMLTQLKFSSNVKDTKALQAIDTILAPLDQAIKDVATTTMPKDQAKAWLDNWYGTSEADGVVTLYSKMLQFKRNKLYNMVVSRGKDAASIAKDLTSIGDTIDDAYFGVNTYKQFRDTLGLEAAKDLEGPIVQELINKHTVGKVNELRATNFVELSNELSQYPFITNEADQIKQVVDRLSEVYKNDPKLLKSAMVINPDQAQQTLAASVSGKIKYGILTRVWRRVQQVAPGRAAKPIALVDRVAKFLEKPLNTKTTQQLLDVVADDQEMTKAIKQLQAAVTEEGIENYNKHLADVYIDNKGRMFLEPGRGRRQRPNEIPLHRVASEQQVLDMLGLDKLTHSSLSKQRKAALLREGIQAVEFSDGQVIKLAEVK